MKPEDTDLGPIAERLSEITTALEQAVAKGDLGAIANGVTELGRLRTLGGEVSERKEQELANASLEERFEKLERADGKLCKAVFTFLDALSQYEETTDVAELYRNVRQSNPDIIISKSVIRAWAAQKGEVGRGGSNDTENGHMT